MPGFPHTAGMINIRFKGSEWHEDTNDFKQKFAFRLYEDSYIDKDYVGFDIEEVQPAPIFNANDS